MKYQDIKNIEQIKMALLKQGLDHLINKIAYIPHDRVYICGYPTEFVVSSICSVKVLEDVIDDTTYPACEYCDDTGEVSEDETDESGNIARGTLTRKCICQMSEDDGNDYDQDR